MRAQSYTMQVVGGRAASRPLGRRWHPSTAGTLGASAIPIAASSANGGTSATRSVHGGADVPYADLAAILIRVMRRHYQALVEEAKP